MGKKELANGALFEFITVRESDRNIAEKEVSGDVPVTADNTAIFAGHNANWKIRWKSVEELEFIGTSVRLRTSKFCMEYHHGTVGFSTFRDFCQRRWTKLQTKMEPPEAKQPDPITQTKTRGVYGRRQYKTKLQKRHQTWGTNRIASNYFSSDDEGEQNDTKPPPVHEEVRKEDSYSNNANMEYEEATVIAEESQEEQGDDEDFDHDSPVKLKQPKKKARIQRKAFLDESDDDALFDAPSTTTPKFNRVVSPHVCTTLRDEDDVDLNKPPSVILINQKISESSDEKSLSPSDAKGTKPLTTYFTARLPIRSHGMKSSSIANGLGRNVEGFLKAEQKKKTLRQDTEWIHTPSKSPQSDFYSPREHGHTSSKETVVASPTIDAQESKVNRLLVATNTETEEDFKCYSKPYLLMRPGSALKRHWSPTNRVQRDPGLKDDDLLDDSGESQTHSKVDSILVPYNKKCPNSVVSNATKSPFPSASPPLWKGLRNMGNTCYLNSSLQMLFTVSGLISRLSGHGGDLANSLVTVAGKLMKNPEGTSMTPRIIKTAIDAATDKFTGYEQRDAHEFLSDLIDRVHDELEEEQKGDKQKDTSDNLPTDEFFRLNVKVCLVCDSCGFERTKEEMYRHLSIEVEEPIANEKGGRDEPAEVKWSVQNGLKKFFAPEKRDVICEHCKIGTTATQTLAVMNRPKALLVHLKRFIVVEKQRIRNAQTTSTERRNDESETAMKNVEVVDEEKGGLPAPTKAHRAEMIIQKIKAPVFLNDSLSLAQYGTKSEHDTVDVSANYAICSIVHHLGSTASSGHYTTDAVRVTNGNESRWVHFDDGVVFPSNKESLLKSDRNQRTAYLLLYSVEASQSFS